MTGQGRRPGGGDPRARRAWPAAVIGAVVGFLGGWAAYSLSVPVLESSQGLLREAQGLAWNLVPLLTLAGGVLGYRWGRSRPPR